MPHSPSSGETLRCPRRRYRGVVVERTQVGIVGTVPFCIGLGLCVRAAWRGRKSVPGIVPLALLATTLTVNLAGTDYELKWFWVVLAYALASETYPRKRRAGFATMAPPGISRTVSAYPTEVAHGRA